MKLFLLPFFLCASYVYAQVVVDSPEYKQLKSANQLGQTLVIPNVALAGGPANVLPNAVEKASSCNCYVEPDSTYTLAMQPNDDGSSLVIPIPFSFCMYGQTFNQVYINNNGNITFTNDMSTYSSTAFPSSGDAIVAPFWGDVDTSPANFGDPANGEVVYKITPTAMYINWEEVGYYASQGDKRNTFQLIITDGVDPVIQSGNVAFCYKDMQWTTGAASMGVNGFGGTPATAGANKGDGISYFLISRFDHPGNDFDGALGNPDGISWLDYKSFAFDVCNTGNVPPIPDGVSSCDTFRVCSFGDTADIAINFLSPETNQSTSIVWNNGGLGSLQEVANSPGNTAQLVLRAVSNSADAGTYTVTVTATDDASPAGVTTLSFVIQIDDSGGATFNPQLSPPFEGCDTIALSVLNGPYDSYLWDDLTTGATSGTATSQDYGVTVSLDGCYRRVHELIKINPPPKFNFTNDFYICPGESEYMFIADSAQMSSISWGLSNQQLDTLFSANLGPGQHNVHLVSQYGCEADTSFTILTQQGVHIANITEKCGDTLEFNNNTGIEIGLWSYFNSAGIPTFRSADSLNTGLQVSAYGVYNLVFTEPVCQEADTVTINFIPYPSVDVDTLITFCLDRLTDIQAYVAYSGFMQTILWNTGALGNTITVGTPGYYSITATNQCGMQKDSILAITKICDFDLPNVFTPNGEGSNNTWKLLTTENMFKEFTCVILNRWGNVVYEFEGPFDEWDGKDRQGNDVAEGVYFYNIKFTTFDGQELEKHGFFHLER